MLSRGCRGRSSRAAQRGSGVSLRRWYRYNLVLSFLSHMCPKNALWRVRVGTDHCGCGAPRGFCFFLRFFCPSVCARADFKYVCFVSRHTRSLAHSISGSPFYYTGCLSCLNALSPARTSRSVPFDFGERVTDAIVRFRGPRALVHEGDDSGQCDGEGDHEGYHERDRDCPEDEDAQCDSQCDRGRR